MLAVLINHPQAFDHVGERLGSLSFVGHRLDSLRQEVLNTLASEPGLDSPAIQRHLTASGYADLIAEITGPSVYRHAFFARPETPLETALEGWDEAFSLYRRRHVKAELDRERAQLVNDPSPQRLARFMATKELQFQDGFDGDDPVAVGDAGNDSSESSA